MVKSKKIISLIIPYIMLIGVFVLFFILTLPNLIEGVPPGGDSNVYIMDSYSQLETNSYFSRYYSEYLGRNLYESPIHSLILITMHKITGLDIEYPLFSIYQYGLIMLIFLLIFLITKKLFNIYSAIITTFSILAFNGFYFLFYSSTVANFFGTVLILLALLAILTLPIKKLYFIIALLLIALFFTHKSLTFIFALLTIAVYFGLHIKKIYKWFLGLNLRLKLFVLILLSIILITFIYFYMPITNIINPEIYSTTGRFRGEISFSSYIGSVGGVMVAFFLIFPFINKYKVYSKRKLYVLYLIYIWIFWGIIFSLLPYFGVYFYSYRMFYMIWPLVYIPVIFCFLTLLKRLSKKYKALLITLFFIFIFCTAIMSNQSISNSTIFINENQVSSLQYIKEHTLYGERILTNINNIHPYNISVATRVFVKRYYDDFPLALEVDYLKENKISYIFIAEGDKKGVKLSKYDLLLKDVEYLRKVNLNKETLVYQVNIDK